MGIYHLCAIAAKSGAAHTRTRMMPGLIIGISVLSGFLIPLLASWESHWAYGCVMIGASVLASLMARSFKRLWLGMMIFFIPLNADINFMIRPSPGGADSLALGMVDIILFVLILLWLGDNRTGSNQLSVTFYSALGVPFLLIITMSFGSMLVAREPIRSIFDIMQWLKAFLLYFFLVNNLKGRKDIEFILHMLFMGVIVQSIVLYLQQIQGGRLGLFGLGEAADVLRFEINTANVFRPGGTIGHCNHLSRYIAMIFPVALMMFLKPEKSRSALLPGLTCFTGGLALVLTLTRTAWLATIISVTLAVILAFRARILTPRMLVRLLGCLLVLMIITAIYGSLIQDRITTDDFGSGHTRYTTARVAWNIIKDNPVLGVGMNNYGTVLEKYWDVSDSFTRRAAVHNTYLLLAAEIGIPGLILYLVLHLQAVRILWHSVFIGNIFSKTIAIGFLTSYIGFFLMALTDKSYKENMPLLFLMAVVLAVIVANYRIGLDGQLQAET